MVRISTKAELEEYRANIRARILSVNPDRDFEVLFGDIKSGTGGFLVIWLDGKGPLNDC
jgi:hypothetical protein